MQKSIYTQQHQRLCELLIEARKKAGLTQVEVAERLGKPQSFVAKYEGGERRLDVIEFLAVADVIGVVPASLLDLLRGG
ncbi:helix-turn-helix domain-containing protein [Microvirga subterranea]|uniref:Xre family transcriptional regulator n=1 Tax=Microvirga subterranea TaxID=186651 RepID=A0A370HL22_9HYPH|nr:helix-turn-helix transcriptional regulator [Microvirga subterranea]RDI59189.1 Xre family transcriptional regulator [Microvirga subterranea]